MYNTQPDGEPTDIDILAAKRLGVSPEFVKNVWDVWMQAFDDIAEWVEDGNTPDTFKDK